MDQYPEAEAILVDSENEAVSAVRSTLLIWVAGFLIILANIFFNPAWENNLIEIIWLPVVYIGAVFFLLIGKFNRETDHGRIVFERDFIRVIPKDGTTRVYRISELRNMTISPGKAGFIRNPFNHSSLGFVQFFHADDQVKLYFRFRSESDARRLTEHGLL